MATITDQLITVFKTLGGPEYQRAFDQAAEANRKLSREEKKRAADLPVSKQAAGIATFAQRLTAASAALFVFREAYQTVSDVVAAGTRPFAEQEQAVFRMQLVLRNLGRAAEIPALDAFNRQLASSSGQTTTALSSLTALLTQFNLTESEIKRATPVLIDWSTAVGIDLPRAADILGSALRNEKDAIQRYGVDIDLTKSRAEKLNQALTQLEDRFRGGQAAQQNTLLGSLTRLQNAFTELVATLGRLLGPQLTTAIKVLSAAIEGWTLGIKAVVGLLERVGVIPRVGAAAGQVGTDGRIIGAADMPKESTQKKIEKNTRDLAGALSRQVLGGGPVLNAAFNFRGLNAALRAAR